MSRPCAASLLLGVNILESITQDILLHLPHGVARQFLDDKDALGHVAFPARAEKAIPVIAIPVSGAEPEMNSRVCLIVDWLSAVPSDRLAAREFLDFAFAVAKQACQNLGGVFAKPGRSCVAVQRRIAEMHRVLDVLDDTGAGMRHLGDHVARLQKLALADLAD